MSKSVYTHKQNDPTDLCRSPKCTAERPSCAACIKFGRSCLYDSLEGETRFQAQGRKLREHDEDSRKHVALYEFLQTRDRRNVDSLLQRIRSGEDVDEVIRTIDAAELLLHSANALQASSSSSSSMATGSGAASSGIRRSSTDGFAGGVALRQQYQKQHHQHQQRIGATPTLTGHRPSDYMALRGQLPRTSSGLEFELTSRHQVAYPTLLPLDVSQTSFNPFENPRRLSAFSTPIHHAPGNPSHDHAVLEDGAVIRLAGELSYRVNEPRLEDFKVTRWSTAPISDESAAMLISAFLDHENSIIGFFDADLFLEDLENEDPSFCSPMLVNSVLYVAAHAFTAADHRAAILCRFFFDACQSLFVRPSEDDVCTLAAINVFSLGCFYEAHDELGHELLAAARDMGRRLDLYGVHTSNQDAHAIRELPTEWIRATSHVAWGTFNWLTFHALFYYHEPVAVPPILPIPGVKTGGLPGFNAQWHDWPTHPLPEYMGSSFSHLSELFTIAQEIAVVYISAGAAPARQRVPLLFAEAKYQKMLAWADSLGEEMKWNDKSPHHLILLHMWFHCVVLDLFRPFLNSDRNSQLKSFFSADATPQAIFSASINQLQRLVLVYCSNAEFERAPFVNIALMHIMHVNLKRSAAETEAEAETPRYYVMVCVRYWQQLYVGYPMFGDVARAFLSLALRTGTLRKTEVRTLLAELREHGQLHQPVEDGPTATIIVDFELAMESPEEARARVIARRLGSEMEESDEELN